MILGGEKTDVQTLGGNLVMDKVEVNFDVLCSSVGHWVGNEVCGPKIVAPENRFMWKKYAEFFKE